MQKKERFGRLAKWNPSWACKYEKSDALMDDEG